MTAPRPQARRRVNRQTSTAARRVADSVVRLLPPQQIIKINGTVYAVAVGAGTDGGDVVTVTLGTDNIPMVHLGTTPAVGAMVAVLIVNGSPLCLGKPVGIPT